MDSKTATKTLRTAIRARTPIIAVESPEEQRILALVQEMAKEPTISLTGEKLVGERTVYRWTHTEGIVQLQPKANGDEEFPEHDEPTNDPVSAILDYIDYARGDGSKAQMQERASLLVMCDLHRFLDGAEAGGFANPLTLRAVRDLHVALSPTASAVILLSPRFTSLGDADRDVLRITWPLPTVAELTCLTDKVAQKMEMRGVPVDLNGDAEVLARAMAGLTETEARRALSLAIIEAKELSVAACGGRIVSHKAEILEAQQGVQLIEPSETLDDIGGLDLLKAEMRELPRLLTQEAKAAKVRAPRGFLFAGPPGTGKSLSAKVASGGVMPILRWEPAGSKSKWVGESTANTSAVLRAADAINECVLWIDEADTGLKDSTEGDSGVGDEMMGLMLTWMQERESDVVVVMTTNHPERLRHAMMERLDRKFFVDYPGFEACVQIVKIHLRKRNLSLSVNGIAMLAQLAVSKNLAGRNIEQAIEAAHRIAFLDDRDLTTGDVADQLKQTKGLVEQRPQEAKDIREWCQLHCLPASSPDAAPTTEQADDDVGLEI